MFLDSFFPSQHGLQEGMGLVRFVDLEQSGAHSAAQSINEGVNNIGLLESDLMYYSKYL